MNQSTPHKLRIYTDHAMELHDPGPGHPERPARLQVLRAFLEQQPIEGVDIVQPRAATDSQLKGVHDVEYVDMISSLRGHSKRLDADTSVSPKSVDSAYLAAGAAIDAVNCVMRSEATGALALVRPPGHHAERNRAMGFCLFNNIAIAAQHAIDVFGCKRVLIVDWDVHHGNGTQHIFESRRDVLYFSSHEWPLYPGTGSLEEIGIEDGKGFTVNAPLPAGTDDETVIDVYRRLLVPVADAYRPDLVLISAGFDAHRDDPLANLRMTEAGFATLASIVRDIANHHCNGKIAFILEGGYNLNALTAGVGSCIDVLTNKTSSAVDADRQNRSAIADHLCAFHLKNRSG